MKRGLLKRKTPLRARTPLRRHRIDSNGVKMLKNTTLHKTAGITRKRRIKSPLKKLKETLWQLCREIQIKQYGRTCYTCGAKNLEGSNCHLGHFIPSSVCSTEMRYDLANLKPCCYHCNINLSGNWIEYEKHLIRDGVDVQELKDRNERTKGIQYREEWYEAMIEKYRQMV